MSTPANVTSLPSTAIILSRLPAQDWFTIDEAAAASGWGRTFIRECILEGKLAAQDCAGGKSCKSGKPGRKATYRIHVDDLVLFIMRNSRGKYETVKLVSDAALIIRQWPRQVQRGLIIYLERNLSGAPAARDHQACGTKGQPQGHNPPARPSALRGGSGRPTQIRKPS